MKELSIEEKAKAYGGLIERLKDLKFAYRFSPLSDTIDEYFPELAESEDGRIRKELLNYLYDVHDDDEERASWIAWIEKAKWTDADEKLLKNIKQEELTEFEQVVNNFAKACAGLTPDQIIVDKASVERLLSAAKKQLHPEFDKQLEQAYENADEVQYRRGYRKAIDDACELLSRNNPWFDCAAFRMNLED